MDFLLIMLPTSSSLAAIVEEKRTDAAHVTFADDTILIRPRASGEDRRALAAMGDAARLRTRLANITIGPTTITVGPANTTRNAMIGFVSI